MSVIINNKYLIIQKIGEGSFGTIYKCQNIRTKEFVAAKVEHIQNGTKLLKNESKIYNYLSGSIGIPTVKWFGKDNENYYMIINLLGESLESLKLRNQKFSLKLTLQIGKAIINLLKTIHNKGLVHRDIKPDNFLFGINENKNKIYIIDFGFCKLYNENNLKKTNNLVGSVSYASINSHNFCELSRRDDLESLGYLLLYLYLGKLPWQDEKENNEKIKNMKNDILNLNGLHEIFINYFKYVKNLKFEETPDYNYLASNFFLKIDIS
jgi:casein kinase I family protein HRR25